MIQRPQNRHARYHAHVYFDANTRDPAEALCRAAAEKFAVTMGRVHQRPVGPHPRWSCQLAFDASQFAGLIAWLEENRDGLTVLVHGLTGNDIEDHTTHAAWLGEPAALDLTAFND